MLEVKEEVTHDSYMNCLWKADIQTKSLSMAVSGWNREWGLLGKPLKLVLSCYGNDLN